MSEAEPSQQDPRFGRSIVPLAARSAQQRSDLPKQRSEARAMIRDRVPSLAGVYGYLDERGRLLYVGKSKRLRLRLLSYQAANPPDPKMARIIRQARGVMWESCSHELLALIREQELITRWQPSMNRMGQPLRRQPVFIKIDQGIAPGVTVGRQATLDTHICFGPIAGTKEVNQAVVALAYAFGLRDCPSKVVMHFQDQLELFPEMRSPQCLRFELASCPGPCAAGCSKHDYFQRVSQALRFLQGEERSILGTLQQEMFEASERRAFERAAILRNQFEQLSWIDRRLETLRRAQHDLHGLLPLPGFRGRHVWLVMQRGQLVEILASSGGRSDRDALQHVTSRAALASRATGPVSMHQVYIQMILHSWFRKHPQDLDQLIPFQQSVEAALEQVAQKQSTTLGALDAATHDASTHDASTLNASTNSDSQSPSDSIADRRSSRSSPKGKRKASAKSYRVDSSSSPLSPTPTAKRSQQSRRRS